MICKFPRAALLEGQPAIYKGEHTIIVSVKAARIMWGDLGGWADAETWGMQRPYTRLSCCWLPNSTQYLQAYYV